MELYLTAKDVMARLHCSQGHVNRLAREGCLPRYKLGRKFARYKAADVEAYMQSGLSKGAQR